MIAHLESERGVLGCMLLSPAAVSAATQRLVPKDFADPAYREIYSAMFTLALGGQKIDIVTLDGELQRRGHLDAVGGPSKLVEIYSAVPSAVNVSAYIDQVLEKSKLRALAAIAEAISRRVNQGGATAEDVIALTESACWDIANRTKKDEGWVTLEDAAMWAYEAAGREPDAIPTGFAELDRQLNGGLWRSELIIVGARPGKGKSAFMLASAMHAARCGHIVGYFSLEMPPVQNGQRALAVTSQISISRQRQGKRVLTEMDWTSMSGGLDRLHDDMGGRFRLYKGTRLTLEKVAMIARHARDCGELDLLVIDYLQLMRTTEKTSNAVERIGYISGELKQLALELGIPILTASQIRRQGAEEKKKNPRAPTLDELRGSGDLEQDADTVLLAHMPDDENDSTLSNLPEEHAKIWDRAKNASGAPFTVEVAKQRMGPLGRTWCIFKGSTMRFIEDGGYGEQTGKG